MPPFFNTNVLIYAVDEEDSEKHEIAGGLVQEYLVAGDGMISVQAFCDGCSCASASNATTTKVRALLRFPAVEASALGRAAQEMVGYFAAFSPIPENAGTVLGAVRRSREYGLSFRDALILESALKGGADRLLTEDLQHGQEIAGLRIENPFL
jgi:predicted nucleic acid-binding protein